MKTFTLIFRRSPNLGETGPCTELIEVDEKNKKAAVEYGNTHAKKTGWDFREARPGAFKALWEHERTDRLIRESKMRAGQ